MSSLQDDEPAFCSEGMPMAMFMDGFRWSLHSSHPQHSEEQPPQTLAVAIDPISSTEEEPTFSEPLDNITQLHRHILEKHINPCLTYLVPAWLLDTAGRFQGAMVFSFLLAFLMEVLSVARNAATRQFRARPLSSRGQEQQEQSTSSSLRIWQHLILTLIYVLNTILGYILMFMAMSFSLEIFLSTVAGFIVGHWLFFEMVPTHQLKQRQRQPPAATEPLLSSSSP